MDEELQRKIEEARQAGYSDEEINQYIQSLNQPPSTTQPGTFTDGTPVVPANPPMNRSEEYIGLGEGIAGKALETGAELYAGKKLILDPLVSAVRGRGPAGPVMPSPANQPSVSAPKNPIAMEPMRPVAPAPEPMLNPTWDKALKAEPKSPSMISRGAEYASKIRELAAQKAMQAAPLVRAGAGIAAAVTPGNVGQNYNVPQTGPLRGSEINPATRRPWTPEELARYNQQFNR
jgi:hypothetical protein